jgi:hypothetical protein
MKIVGEKMVIFVKKMEILNIFSEKLVIFGEKL